MKNFDGIEYLNRYKNIYKNAYFDININEDIIHQNKDKKLKILIEMKRYIKMNILIDMQY